MKRLVHHTTLIIFTLFLLAACGGGGGTSIGTSSGGDVATGPALRVSITDAPFSLDKITSAVVLIESMEVRPLDGEFVPLEGFTPKTLDLIQLQNGLSEVIYEGNPPPGVYDEIRLISTALEIVLVDGDLTRTITDFKIPSGEQTGIKVKIEPNVTVVTELTADLMLDYDLSRSFVPQGDSKSIETIKSFNFKPVVRAVNISTAGTLTFRVLSDNGTPETSDDFLMNGVAYDLFDDTQSPSALVASGASAMDPAGVETNPYDQGYVFHPAIPAGVYRLELSRIGYTPLTIGDVEIIIANLTDLGDIALQADSASISGTVTSEIIDNNGTTFTFPLPSTIVSATPDGEVTPVSDTTSDAEGEYLLEVTPPLAPLYTVTGSKAGYSPDAKQSPATVSGATATAVDLHLMPLTDNLIVTVMDQNSTPLEGTEVSLFLDDGITLMGTGITDVAGQVIFANMPTASYLIEASTLIDPLVSGQNSFDHTGGTGVPGEAAVVLVLPTP
ncbi:MAG: hypothetical protein C0609_09720 [Deltaproteobacteria bacterium]|nr:MAG: hypothetical protein C0609_09720 [Deltaproteobacteria bacterium]